MEKYVIQLLADLQEAKKRKPEKPNVRVLYPDHPAFDFGLDYIVEWEMAAEIFMQELFGIQAMEFPPIDKLKSNQLQQLVEGILDLWQEYGMFACFPENLPCELKYRLLVEEWNEPFRYVSEGMMDFTFCEMCPEECPFGEEYCSCRDIEDEIMEELFEKFNNRLLPGSMN